MKRNLDDYVDVATRIARFYERFPEGSLQSEIIFDDGKRVVTKSFAFRKPDDPTPAIGHAEEIRGDGPVNKTSALENCETSSTGRALAMLGLEVKKGIASREEVEQAQAEEKRQGQEGWRDPGKPETKEVRAGSRTSRASELRNLVRVTGLVSEAQMYLTSLGVEKLDDLTEAQATEFDEWLGSTADQKAQAA